MATALTAVAAVAALAGCSQFDAALGQRQAIVSFRDEHAYGPEAGHPYGLHQGAGRDPAGAPVGPYFSLRAPAADLPGSHASDADVASLEKCLSKFPSVAGVTLQDSSDDGN